MTNDLYKFLSSQGSGYDGPPQSSPPPYDQSTFNQSNESYPPLQSSDGFQTPVGFMGSVPLGRFNPALERYPAAYSGYSNANDNLGANYGYSGLTDNNTFQPTSNMQDYSAGLTSAPVPAGESAFADPSQNFMHYVGPGTPGARSTNIAMQAPSDHYWPGYTEPNTDLEYSSLPQPNTSRPRFYCTFPGCTGSFGRKPDLDRHVMCLHDSPRNFHCPNCKRAFNRKDNLTAHISSVHGPTGRRPPR